jgi:hypothetical protein
MHNSLTDSEVTMRREGKFHQQTEDQMEERECILHDSFGGLQCIYAQ